MAIPELTRAGVAPFVTEQAAVLLNGRFADEEIPQLFSDAGVLRKGLDGNLLNICMKWHYNELNAIDGAFFRIISEGNLIAWLKPDVCRNTHNFICIQNASTELQKKPVVAGWDPNEVLTALLAGKTEGVSPRFDVKHLDNIPGIAAFFDQDRHVLPDTLRERIFLPVTLPIPEAPITATNPRTRTYVIGGIFLVLAVGYVAHRIIDKYRAPQTPPGEHLEKALKARNPVSTG